MFKSCKKYSLLLLIFVFLFFNIFLFSKDFHQPKDLTFVMFDVGQGDGLFIESPTGVQILFDAGPPRKILNNIYSVMSSFDKHIDAIFITNPDTDHIGGFMEVLKNYKVDYVFEPGTINDSKTYQNLKQEIKNKNIIDILARRKMMLDIGSGAYIEILFPDRDVSTWATNDGSIIARLVYGQNSIMLTGDATNKTERIILEENSKEKIKSNILKVGHHGSRTSTSQNFVKIVAPTYALISDGKDNKYGHPHRETLQTLEKFGVKILRTDMLGTIIVKCDMIKICKIN